MARATRSAVDHEKVEDEGAALPPQKSTKSAGKKRKRVSDVNPDEQPASKLAKSDTSIKEEDVSETVPVVQQGAGDVPLDAHNAQRILDILEKYVCSAYR